MKKLFIFGIVFLLSISFVSALEGKCYNITTGIDVGRTNTILNGYAAVVGPNKAGSTWSGGLAPYNPKRNLINISQFGKNLSRMGFNPDIETINQAIMEFKSENEVPVGSITHIFPHNVSYTATTVNYATFGQGLGGVNMSEYNGTNNLIESNTSFGQYRWTNISLKASYFDKLYKNQTTDYTEGLLVMNRVGEVASGDFTWFANTNNLDIAAYPNMIWHFCTSLSPETINVSILSPKQLQIYSTSVDLNWTANASISNAVYSIDGGSNQSLYATPAIIYQQLPNFTSYDGKFQNASYLVDNNYSTFTDSQYFGGGESTLNQYNLTYFLPDGTKYIILEATDSRGTRNYSTNINSRRNNNMVKIIGVSDFFNQETSWGIWETPWTAMSSYTTLNVTSGISNSKLYEAKIYFNISGMFNKTIYWLSEGTHTIKVYAQSSATGAWFNSSLVTFYVDLNNPNATSNLHTNTTIVIVKDLLTLQFNYTDAIKVLNFSISTPEGYFNISNNVNQTLYTWNGTIPVSAYAIGKHNVSTSFCDAAGHCDTKLFYYYVYNYTPAFKTTGVLEKETERYSFLINVSSNVINFGNTQANLVFNGTVYSLTKQTLTNAINFSTSLTIPSLSSQIATMNFYFNYTFDGITKYNSINYSQTAYKPLVAECNNSISNTTLNISFRNITNNNLINSTWSFLFSAANFNYTISGIANNALFCIYPPWANFSTNIYSEYSASTYESNTYTATGVYLNNVTQILNLYLISAGASTPITIIIKDAYGNALESMNVEAYRYDASTNTLTLQSTKTTDASGTALFYLDTTKKYQFIVKDSAGTIQYTSTVFELFATSYTFIITEGQTQPYNDLLSLSRTLVVPTSAPYNVTYTWDDIGGLTEAVCLSIGNSSIINTTEMYHICSTEISGTLSYLVSGEGYYSIVGSVISAKDGQRYILDTGSIHIRGAKPHTKEEMFLAFIFIGTLTLVGMVAGRYSILAGSIVIIFMLASSILMYLVGLLNIKISGLIFLCIMGIIVMIFGSEK